MPQSDKPYLNFVIEPELLRRIDDFRFRNRFPTRAAAIKWLLDWCLDEGISKAGAAKKKRTRADPSRVAQ